MATAALAPRSTPPAVLGAARVARGLLAVYDTAALVVCVQRGFKVPGFTVANFFSYFTVLSNVLAVLVLLVGAVATPRSAQWQVVRCSVTIYIVITGIIYALLLSRADVGVDNDWTNDALHRVIPLVLLVDWVVFPAARAIGNRTAMVALVFPLLYGVYTLIRGPIVDWYPYPFIDPRQTGYLSMSLGLVVIVVGFVMIALAVNQLGRLGTRWRHGGSD
ncbi:Pr6Pr family membrane protein [Nakamurella endophytica]|uniref:FAR-17a/AIG1-like protein n=1 Tax=Nakamurella endophytica TaxID=1748367 RepID=A0A917SXL1_9ACTN|nr:Pr6Pr family membrane protein [Nakamurella endophytica]GGM01825.1 hypothetical protein GCM10011594_22350 [Nakamurella endophytica]